MTIVAPLESDQKTGQPSRLAVCRRGPMESRAEVEKALAACRQRTPRLPLVDEAKARDGVIEVLSQVGDFLARDEPLFALYGGAAAIDDAKLQATVAFGSERTMEQDPMFAFRILVDIALKALSPAINDPTTAVLAIDQVHRLLRAVGKRRLHGDEIYDNNRIRRVVYRTPDWQDYVHVAFTEIRACGAGNIQIARRLRAMIENLFVALPPHRHDALDAERLVANRISVAECCKYLVNRAWFTRRSGSEGGHQLGFRGGPPPRRRRR